MLCMYICIYGDGKASVKVGDRESERLGVSKTVLCDSATHYHNGCMLNNFLDKVTREARRVL